MSKLFPSCSRLLSPLLLRDLLLRTTFLLASLAISGPTALTVTASSSVTPDTSRCARHAVLALRTAGKLGFVFMKRVCRLAITAGPQVSEALPRALLEVTAAPPDLMDTMGKAHREVRVLPAPRDITAAPQVSEALPRDLLEVTAASPDLTDTMGKAHREVRVPPGPRDTMDRDLQEAMGDLPLVDLPGCKEEDD